MSTTAAYLAFKDNHIITIDNLEPELIKQSTKKMKKDRKNISHTSILNHIAKSLGVTGGFQGYLEVYNQNITAFLKEHELNRRKDLFSIQKPGYNCGNLRIKRQRLSQRLFNSGRELPDKVFTGYNFDFENTIDDQGYMFSNTLNLLSNIAPRIGGYSDIAKNIMAIKDIKTQRIKSGSKTLQIQDIIIGGYFWELYDGYNLLGDLLIQPRKQENVHQIYNKDESDESFKRSISQRNKLLDLFYERISNQKDGWVTVIPFNKNLVFLKGQDGEYDFLFRDQKDTTFIHQVFDNKLKISDVPYFVDNYSFDRWKYFEYKGWTELDEHESERHYYMSGGIQPDYPGETVILRTYYKDKFIYKQKSKQFVSSSPTDKNFYNIELLDHHLSVSNPVSISDFFEFLRDRPDYKNYRSGENINNINADSDLSLPAACTWYDALAYCTWFKEKYDLPVRLLSIDEYKALRLLAGPITPNYEHRSGDGFYQGFQYCKDLIYSNENKSYIGHPPYMTPNKFDSLELRFIDDLKFLNTDKNIRFVDSNDFSEWNSEASCIRSGNLKGFRGNDKILQEPPLDCAGKYKHQKIGFRLCLDIKPN